MVADNPNIKIPRPPAKPEAESGLAAPTGSAADLKAKIARMRECRKWSSGYYSVHVDELHELLSILEIIIERQEPPNVCMSEGATSPESNG